MTKDKAPVRRQAASKVPTNPQLEGSNAPARVTATPGAPLRTSTGTDELVYVNVPKMANGRKFNFVTPDHMMHTYASGEQNMRRSIAESSYAKAHGIEIIGDAE